MVMTMKHLASKPLGEAPGPSHPSIFIQIQPAFQFSAPVEVKDVVESSCIRGEGN